MAIIKKCKLLNYGILGSSALDLEICQIPDIYKRQKVSFFYERTITGKIIYNQAIQKRVKELQEMSAVRMLDRFHLAFAENAQIDILLTTDLRFEKACSKMNLNVKVLNPINYFMEVSDDSSS
ncbi:MAG: hypothetical protein LBC75_07750 [Fibromonadaceae bacterium]|nr:hypothetical protein [Fibromonadaceae bacterium]